MQANDEADKHLKNKGDEDAINFRPSSNFKYMKKYCKGGGKVESARGSSGEGEGEGESPQPPLPREPPPPDSPPAALVTPKQEVDEEEFAPLLEEEGKDRVMCRQFARGACTRGPACIYAHEIILSQLPGIYTFCRDYQNSTCSFPRCKFVHATVFEKECFYRTGFLPPHATDHLKEGAGPAPPPPPEGGRAEAPAAFPTPAPAAFPTPAAGSLPHLGGGAYAGGAEPRPSGEALGALAAAAPSLKREYRDIDDLGAAAAREPARADPPALRDKCSGCDFTAFRRQCQRNKMEKLKRSIQDLDRKTSLLDKKNAKQLAVLLALLKYSSGAANLGSSLFNNANIRNDKEKAIMDKLSVMFPSAAGGHPSALDDNNKTLTTVLVRLLLNTSEDAAPAPPS